MQYTPENAQKILAGLKTQTRRLAQDGDELIRNAEGQIVAVRRNGRTLYRVGQVRAVQPGRGKPGIGFHTITRIRRECIQDISESDAEAEGVGRVSSSHWIWGCRAVERVAALWDSIYQGQSGKQWADNPVVYALDLALHTKQLPEALEESFYKRLAQLPEPERRRLHGLDVSPRRAGGGVMRQKHDVYTQDGRTWRVVTAPQRLDDTPRPRTHPPAGWVLCSSGGWWWYEEPVTPAASPSGGGPSITARRRRGR